jgi:uncharacterized membrane protein HdeD (DUF308 family)
MKRSFWWLIGGILSVVGGLFALFNPVVGSFTAEFMAAITFIAVGIVLIIGLFSQERAGTKLWMGLLGVALVFVGYQLLANPLAGLLSLTAALGFVMSFEAITKFFLAFSLDRNSGFWLMLLSAALSAVLAYLIFSDFLLSSATMLGIFLGIDLLMNGVSMISLWNEARKIEA